MDDVPEKVTSVYTVNLCALSAQLRPRTTTLSHVVTCASRSAIRAARSLATFSAAVSVGLAAKPGGGGRLGVFGLGARNGWALVLSLAVELEVDDGMVCVGLLYA